MSQSDGIHRRIFIKSAVAAGISLVGMSGCGSDDGTFIGSQGSGGSLGPVGVGGGGGTPPPTDVPALTPTVRVEPQVVPGLDAGTRHSVRVVAAQGGSFTLPNGVQIVIPAGALPGDQEISVIVDTNPDIASQTRALIFEPSGLTFSTPIFITIPFETLGEGAVAWAHNSSALNPLEDVGSELVNWELSPLTQATAGSLTFTMSHFSVLFAVAGIDAGMYLVTDIPPENLELGDLLFTLTPSFPSPVSANDPGIKWRTGHVSILLKNGPDGAALAGDPSRCIEMPGGPGRLIRMNDIVLADQHIYLGPRRHPAGLTVAERERLRAFLLSKVNAPYAFVGDAGADVTPIPGFTDVGYSCVGLAEAGHRHLGKPLLSRAARQTIATPLEYFLATRPVTEIEVVAGKKFEMPVYGVIARYLVQLVPPVHDYSRNEFYSVVAQAKPEDSTFLAAQLPTAQGAPAPGYKFSWTPDSQLIGQTVELKLRMTATRKTYLSNGFFDSKEVTIKMKVVASKLSFLTDTIYEAFVNLGDDGLLVYAFFDAQENRRRLHRRLPSGSETTLDLSEQVKLIEGNAKNKLLGHLEEYTGGTQRHTFLAYAVPAEGALQPTVLASLSDGHALGSASATAPGFDFDYLPVAFTSNELVVGTYARFQSWAQNSLGSFVPFAFPELWWINADRQFAKLTVNERILQKIHADHPVVGTLAEAVALRVLDANSSGVVLLAASLNSSDPNTGGTYRVIAATYHLVTGTIVELAYMTGPSVPDLSGPEIRAIPAGRINDHGDVVISRKSGSDGSGGLVAEYHKGTANGVPAREVTRTRSSFWVNSINSRGEAGGFSDRPSRRAEVWKPETDAVLDIHAQALAAAPNLEGELSSSVARLGDDGTVVARIIGRQDNGLETVRDFVILP